MLRIAILFGGKSCENEISVLTGVFVLNLLDKEKYLPVPVYIHTDGSMYTSAKMIDLNVFKKRDYSSFERIFFDGGSMYAFSGKAKVKNRGKIDAAINCCHGGLGEGGGISALMQLNEIPLASPELTASGMFMDKTLTKLVAKALNVPTVEYIRVNESDYNRRGRFLLKNIESRLKYPVVIKPAHLGSSIGISVAETEEEAAQAIEAAFYLDDRVVIEKYLRNKRDINCAAYSLGGDIYVSEPEEAASGDKIYSFADKYLKSGERPHSVGRPTVYPEQGSDDEDADAQIAAADAGGGESAETVPSVQKSAGTAAAMANSTRETIRSYTRTLYKRMNLKGIVRMDFLLCDGKIYLGEVNTVPGSLAYYLFCEHISDAKNLFSALLDDALKNAEEGQKRVITTGILQSVSVSGKRGGVRL